MPLRIAPYEGGVGIAVKVVPGAARDCVVGELGDALKIAVSKPPQGGAANRAVIELLAEAMDLPRHAVTIVRGHRSPRKQIHIAGVTATQVRQRLA